MVWPPPDRKFLLYHWRLLAGRVLLVAATTVACGGNIGLFRQYEYEEDMYLSLDGTATLYVNTSVAALDALRGASFNTSPDAATDRNAITAYFSSPVTHVRRVTTWRRAGRRFVGVRMDVDDVTRLREAKPFAWSTYSFKRDGASDLFLYLQNIGASANKDVGNVGWNGRELVAFRLHLPSKIEYHNAGAGNPKRGNILAWEQQLTDRCMGAADARRADAHAVDPLHRALAVRRDVLAVVIMFAGVIVDRAAGTASAVQVRGAECAVRSALRTSHPAPRTSHHLARSGLRT